MKKALLLFAVVLVSAAPAAAALDMSGAWYDPSTGITWSGTEYFLNGTTEAYVDYVVEWVGGPEALFKYSYQIRGLGSAPISQLTVTMLPSNEAQDIGYAQTVATDLDPTSMALVTGANASWSFSGVSAGASSSELFYYSVNKPLTFLGSVVDGGVPVNGMLPSPSNEIPEPMTMSLLAAGGLLGVLRKRR